MKNPITFLFFLIILSFSELKAQQLDSTAKMPVMQQKYLIFVAEVTTQLGLQKGIFYSADSSKIVILDSLYRSITIPITDIQSLILKRSNALGFNFRIGFFATMGFWSTITFLLSTGGYIKTAGAVLGVLGVGAVISVLFGAVLLAGATSPNMKIMMDKGVKDYYRKLRSLQERSQERLVRLSMPKPKKRRV
jgi:hypothetical protein